LSEAPGFRHLEPLSFICSSATKKDLQCDLQVFFVALL
jgi:hypothetical protein